MKVESTQYDPTDINALLDKQAQDARMSAAEAKQFREDWKWLVAHKPGRRILWWLLSRTGVFRNPWRPSASEHSYLSGVMAVGQMLLTELMVTDPDAYITMMKEAKAHDDAKRSSSRNS